MWRYFTVLGRQKGQVTGKFLQLVFYYLVFVIIFRFAVPATQYGVVEPLDQIFVASSDPSDGSNGFYSTEQLLQNCTRHNATTIGAVEYPDDENAINVLHGVFDDISKAVLKFQGEQYSLQTFKSTDALDDYISERDYSKKQLCFSMGFDEFDTESNDYSVAVRYPAVSLPLNAANQTDSFENLGMIYNIHSQQLYEGSGFLNVMSSVTKNIIKLVGTTQEDPSFQITYLPMTTTPYAFPKDTQLIAIFLPIIFMQIQFFAATLRGIYAEPHEHKVKWILGIMGQKKSVNFTEDMLHLAIPNLIIIPLVNLLVCFLIIPSLGYFFFTLCCAFFVIETFAIFAICFYALGNYGVLLYVIINLSQILFNVIINLVGGGVYNAQLQLSMCWLPLQQINVLINISLNADAIGGHVNFANLNQAYLNITTSTIFYIGLVETIFFVILLIYFWPYQINKDPEAPLKWYYPCTTSYWRSRKNKNTFDENAKNSDEQKLLAMDQEKFEGNLLPEELLMVKEGTVEEPTIDLQRPTDVLRIRNLVKKYKGATKPSINNLNLSAFKDELLVLLGHNGAGKTTSISCLTGLVKPSSGSATSFGIDIFNNRAEIQDFIGVCPQENVLLEKMSIGENIKFFGEFKGLSPDVIEQQTVEFLKKFGMENKRESIAGQVSGGQKRKLQLIIAMLGNSQIVLLDEPSSGMDPTSRRDTWEVIKSFKQNRIVILTTHYMDEAEALADRVAIMSQGKLICNGSPLFLKNKYGKGFYLEVEKLQDSKDMEELEKVLVKCIPEYEINVQQSNNGNTEYNLPASSAENFEELFKYIDENRNDLNILRYNLRVASLEEVFIEIGKNEDLNQESESKHISSTRPSTVSDLEDSEISMDQLKENRGSFMSLLKQNVKRRWVGGSICCTIIGLPILILLSFAIPAASGIFAIEPTLNFGNPDSIFEYKTPLSTPMNSMTINPENVVSTNDFFNLMQSSTDGALEDYSVDVDPLATTTQESMNNTINEFFSAALQQDIVEFGSYLLYDYDVSNVNIYVYSNATSTASMPVYGSSALQATASYLTGKDISLSFKSQPLPNNVVILQSTNSQVTGGIADTAGFSYIFLSLVIAISYTNYFETGYYTQVLMSGATEATIFWSNYLVDLVIMAYFACVQYIVLFAFGFYLEYYWVPLIIFCIGYPLFVYFIVYWLVQKPAVNLFFAFANIFMLIPLVVATQVAPLNLWSVYTVCDCLFFFLPSCQMTFAMLNIMLAPSRNLKLEGTTEVNTLGMNGALLPTAFLAFDLVFYGLMLFCMLKRKFKQNEGETSIKPQELDLIEKAQIDEDVQKESKRVNNSSCDDILIVDNLVKCYYRKDKLLTEQDDRPEDENDSAEITEVSKQDEKAKKKKKKTEVIRNMAVKGVSFGVAQGETFALLGVNGAGKSSTFNCMMGKETISGGQVMLNNLNMKNMLGKPFNLHGSLGYCPQTDCFEGSLSVYDQLVVIARLKGIKEEYVEAQVNMIIQMFALADFKDKGASVLSGGNKRKLCCAMAVIGQPKVVFIDEASAGVDPNSRRQMWKGIKYYTKNSATIITTHAMEEAEALASKIGIMVAGRLNCYGSKESLKSIYGSGYEIKIKIDVHKLMEERHERAITSEENWEESQFLNEQQIKEYLETWQRELDNQQVPMLINFVQEFSPQGMLSKHYNRVTKSQEQTVLIQLKRDALIYNLIMLLCKRMTEDVALTTVAQVDQANVNLRMVKHQRSMGFMFSYMEQLKQTYYIKEYSAQQSTLEQIFNMFAKGKAFKRFNKKLTFSSMVRDDRVRKESTVNSEQNNEIDLVSETDFFDRNEQIEEMD